MHKKNDNADEIRRQIIRDRWAVLFGWLTVFFVFVVLYDYILTSNSYQQAALPNYCFSMLRASGLLRQ